ncbi:hypothetical protein ACN08Z_07485 [Rothia sp. P7181]|uniref:hypothetical protein n=1 Tax=unclassified Rothia (in: high G+C Gram-positive bacteria) TaxID=2689056 RepID=UPI003ACCCDC1
MREALILASEHGEHAEHLVYGIPTYVYLALAVIAFTVMFFICISFSGRGIVRPEHGPNHIGSDEVEALADYHAKHSH